MDKELSIKRAKAGSKGGKATVKKGFATNIERARQAGKKSKK